MVSAVILGLIFVHVVYSWQPVETELTLGVLAAEPVEFYGDLCCGLQSYFVIDEARCGRVSYLDGDLAVGMAKFFNFFLHRDYLLGADKVGPNFCLRGG